MKRFYKLIVVQEIDNADTKIETIVSSSSVEDVLLWIESFAEQVEELGDQNVV